LSALPGQIGGQGQGKDDHQRNRSDGFVDERGCAEHDERSEGRVLGDVEQKGSWPGSLDQERLLRAPPAPAVTGR